MRTAMASVSLKLNIAEKHSHFICREWARERDSDVRKGITIHNLTILWFFFLSVPINLRHFYVCITETTFICSYSLTCSHPASWRHMCLYNDETYRVEISPKTWVACIYTLNTVISCILIWIWQGVTLKFKIKKFDDLAKLAQKIKPFQFE